MLFILTFFSTIVGPKAVNESTGYAETSTTSSNQNKNHTIASKWQDLVSQSEKRTIEVDITEVVNEVEMYFPARHIRFNVRNVGSDSNIAEGLETETRNYESGECRETGLKQSNSKILFQVKRCFCPRIFI